MQIVDCILPDDIRQACEDCACGSLDRRGLHMLIVETAYYSGQLYEILLQEALEYVESYMEILESRDGLLDDIWQEDQFLLLLFMLNL